MPVSAKTAEGNLLSCSYPSMRGSTSAKFMPDSNIGKQIPSEDSRDIAKALRKRFAKLPIHKICFQHSYHPTESVLQNLRRAVSPSGSWRTRRLCNRTIVTGNKQDFLGMTPLHVLACANKHNLELYQLLVETWPEHIITKDIWGDPPIVYALYGNAPPEVVQLLAQSHKTLFPEHKIDWVGMVETLARALYFPGRASASLVCIKNLLNIQESTFPDYQANWPQVLSRWAKEDTDKAKEVEAKKVHHDTFKYLIKYSILDRLESLGIEKWRKEILSDVDTLQWFIHYRIKSTKLIYSKLAHYEHLSKLREATSILELALWKTRIDSLSNRFDQETKSCRDREKEICRVRCGTDVVVPNVLSFLLPA